MLAERAYSMWVDLELHFVTPEPTPLGAVRRRGLARGRGAARRGRDLAAHGAHAEHRRRPAGWLAPGGRSLEVERIVTLPRLEGPAIPGLPADPQRLPASTDGHARVHGVADVYAAGDVTAFPIKQGGIACQQADAAAARHRRPRRRAGRAGAVHAGAARHAADRALGALPAPRAGRRRRGRGPRAVVAADQDRRSRARRLPRGPRRGAGRPSGCPSTSTSATRARRDRSAQPALTSCRTLTTRAAALLDAGARRLRARRGGGARPRAGDGRRGHRRALRRARHPRRATASELERFLTHGISEADAPRDRRAAARARPARRADRRPATAADRLGEHGSARRTASRPGTRRWRRSSACRS